jgi:hypothetical protein
MCDETWKQRTGSGHKTWRATCATAWICHETGEVVVTGDPRSVEPPGCTEEEGHNCDAATCGQEHVLARGHVVGVAAVPTREERK